LLFLGGKVLDISDPSSPEIVSIIPSILGDLPCGDWCEIVNDTAYIVTSRWHSFPDTLNRFIVIDLTNPLTPNIIGSFKLLDWGFANSITVRNDTVFIGFYDVTYHSPGIAILAEGLTGLEEKTITPVSLSLSVFPNPFNSSVRISVGAIHELPVQIEIFDIVGKKVFEAPVGEHLRVLPNDGKTHRSSPTETIWSPAPSVPSGVYLVRAIMGDKEITRKAVYLK
jgi:hypothetical protein